MEFLYIIFYNCMWAYSFLKIKSLIFKELIIPQV